MVLKVSKRGVRSGNSFKINRTEAYRGHYSTHAVIFRKAVLSRGGIDKENVLGELDFRSSHVPYSLNKKGRWRLPEIIKQRIDDGDFDEEPVAVQLVERHKLLKRPGCISIRSTKGPGEYGQTSGSGGGKYNGSTSYVNADSILKPRCHTTTRRQRRDRERRGLSPLDEGQDPVFPPNAVRYEVMYPPSPTSVLSYSPKQTRSYRCRCCCEDDSRRVNNDYKELRHYIQEELALFRNDDYMDKQLPNESNLFDSDNCLTDLIGDDNCLTDRNSSISFGETFRDVSAIKKQRKRKRKRSGSVTEEYDAGATKKGNVVYEEVRAKVAAVEGFEADTLSNDRTRKMPVLVSLDNGEVDSHILAGTYGRSYVECDCFPRKFIIDISDRIKHLRPYLSLETSGKYEESELFACVTFCLDIDNTFDNVPKDIYKVTLNTSIDVGYQKIETLFDHAETTVEECLNKAVSFIATLPIDSEQVFGTPKPYFHRPKPSRHFNIEKCVNWQTEVFAPNHRFYYYNYLSMSQERCPLEEDDFEHVKHSNAYQIDTLREISCLTGKFCDICYELLGNTLPGTALTACKHWFCDNCWTGYLESCVNRGVTCLTCPEFDCDRPVDPGTAVTLLGLRDVIRHAKCCHDNEVERATDRKWCPNVKCGSVIQANTPTMKIACCTCGNKFCFDCLGSVHWPAPCQDFSRYFTRLRETGDLGLAAVDVLDKVVVNGKHCPNCNKFVEKSGGCPYMACVCRKSFCWGCGKDWDAYTHGPDCYKFGYNNKHATTEVTVEDERLKQNNKKKKWYNIAVKHRAEQHIFILEKLKAARKVLANRLSSYIGRSVRKGKHVSLDFRGKRSVYRNEQDKLPEYLNDLISLYEELHQVAEYTAVLSDSNTVPTDRAIRFKCIINRLDSLATVIYNGFSQGLHTNPENLLTDFKGVRTNAYKTIKCLAALVDWK